MDRPGAPVRRRRNRGPSPPRTFTLETSKPAVTLTAPGTFVNTARPHFAGAAGALAGDLAPVTVRSRRPTGPAIKLTTAAAGGRGPPTRRRICPTGSTPRWRSRRQLGNHGTSAPARSSSTRSRRRRRWPRRTRSTRPAARHAPRTATSCWTSAAVAPSCTVTAAASGGATPPTCPRSPTAPTASSRSRPTPPATGHDRAADLRRRHHRAGDRRHRPARVVRVRRHGHRRVNCTDAGSECGACDGPATLDASAGDHDIAVTATDRAGNARAHCTPHYTVAAPRRSSVPGPGPALRSPAPRPCARARPSRSRCAAPPPAPAPSRSPRSSTADGQPVNGAWK